MTKDQDRCYMKSKMGHKIGRVCAKWGRTIKERDVDLSIFSHLISDTHTQWFSIAALFPMKTMHEGAQSGSELKWSKDLRSFFILQIPCHFTVSPYAIMKGGKTSGHIMHVVHHLFWYFSIFVCVCERVQFFASTTASKNDCYRFIYLFK